MLTRTSTIALTLLLTISWCGATMAQDATMSAEPHTIVSIKPNYVPPSELLSFLGVEATGGHGIVTWRTSQGRQEVRVRHNETANLIVLSGAASAVAHVSELIKQADTPPRQIDIEVQIVEISKGKASDLGLDFDDALEASRIRANGYYNKSVDNRYSDNVINDVLRSNNVFTTRNQRNGGLTGSLYLSDLLHILDSTGVGTVRSAPRILTLNNRRATVVDGQRVTYVADYSSYSNQYQIDSMDAGLTLSVLPSLGESGYITLQIRAELTTLSPPLDGHGSPVKDGQMLDNTVIVRDGQSVLLGGLTRTVKITSHKRVPLLGHILPFLFSRKVTVDSEIQSYVVLTPHVVDFAGNLDESARRAVEGSEQP